MGTMAVHVVQFVPNSEHGGVEGFDFSVDKDVVVRRTVKYMTEDAGYTVRRWSVSLDAALTSEEINAELEARLDAGVLGKPTFEGTSMSPRDAVDDLAKLAILGSQFKDDTLWAHYFRAIGREDDKAMVAINERRMKTAEQMNEIEAKLGI